jgi:Chlorophyll A-B binding protein
VTFSWLLAFLIEVKRVVLKLKANLSRDVSYSRHAVVSQTARSFCVARTEGSTVGWYRAITKSLSLFVSMQFVTMAKLSFVLLSALAASASAFAPQSVSKSTTSLKAASGDIWDPMGLYKLGSGEAFDVFPGVFPNEQYLQASEIKHGRQAMLAWTGVWATTQVRSFT